MDERGTFSEGSHLLEDVHDLFVVALQQPVARLHVFGVHH